MSKTNAEEFKMSGIAADAFKLPDELAGRFFVMECLKESERGNTYLLAEKDCENRRYVMKCCQKSDRISEIKEGELLRGLRHRGLPRFETEYDDGETLFIIRQHASGVPLSQYLTETDAGNVGVQQIIGIMTQLCDVLTYLHSRTPPIIHRDIKPSNIILNPDDNSIKLIDFGISRRYSENTEKDTEVFGTEDFSPPEQYGFKQTDSRSDLYAVGVLLRWMLTGETDGKVTDRYLSRVAEKCAAFAPKDRYQNAGSLKQALIKYNKKRAGKKIVYAAAAAAVICLVYTAGVFTGRYTGFLDPRAGVQAAESGTPGGADHAADADGGVSTGAGGSGNDSSGDSESTAMSEIPASSAIPVGSAIPESLENPENTENTENTGNSENAESPVSPDNYEDTVFIFSDEMVEKAVRFILRKTDGEHVRLSELDAITGLYFAGEDVAAGEEEFAAYASALDRTEDKKYGSLTDLSDLRSMKNLELIIIHSQPLADLSPLGDSQTLIRLDLNFCPNLIDLSPLSGCLWLEELNLNGCENLKDLSVLSASRTLRIMHISNLLSADLSGLESVSTLRELKIAVMPLGSVSELGGLSQIEWLEFTEMRLRDLVGIGAFTSLMRLSLTRCNIQDFSPLDSLPSLREVNISRGMEPFIGTMRREDVTVVVVD